MSRFRTACVMASLAVVMGCPFPLGGEPEEGPTPVVRSGCIPRDQTPSPTVQLGRADTFDFTPLSTGPRLSIESGFQGGQHVYVTARLAFDGTRPWLLTIEVLEEGALIGGREGYFEPCPSGALDTGALRVFLDRRRPVETAVLRATLRDAPEQPPLAEVAETVSLVL